MSSGAARYVSGVAVHWYTDWLVPASVLDRTHKLYPDVPILYTESCTGKENLVSHIDKKILSASL